MVMKALVVDDSRALRAIMGRILREIGFDVAEAADGKAALDVLAQKGPFDVALVDWNMPVMNGLELIQAVKGDASLSSLRILMVTTESEATQIVTALEAGAGEYLMKPFTKEAVVDKLALLGVKYA